MSEGRPRGGAYAFLLYVFPTDFRREFGEDLVQLHRDRLSETEDRWGRAVYRVQATVDVLAEAAHEWGQRVRTWAREGTGMDGWKQDVMFAVRTLRRRPGFTLAAVVTLALGIGATVSMFTVVNGVLLNPLPYPDSDDLVVLWTRDTESGNRSRSVDHPDVRAIQAGVPGLRLAGYSGTRPTLTGFGDPQIVFGARVTDGMVELMGLEPLMGRDLNAADDVAGGPGVAVVSHSFWRERLSGDPDVLGRTLVLSDVPWEIVGVAPEGFDYPGGSDVWLPRRHEDDGCDHGCRIMNAVGRIEASASFEEVASALEATSARLEEEFPDVHRAERFQLEAMLAYEVADVRTALWVLLGAVGMVLLIACANVANLLLVRAAGRRAEVSLRATLGASRARIARQLLTESGLIALVAGVAGLALAYWGTAALVGLAPDDLPRLDQAKVGGSVIAFTGTLVVLVTGLFGVLPAMHMSRGVDASRGGRGMAGSRQSARSRHALLVGEVALSLTLLLGAGLLFRTLDEMNAVELGFEVERVERFRVSLPDVRYDSVSVGPFLEQIEMELTRLPGVAAAGWGFGVPLASGNISASTHLLDRPEVAPPDQPVFDLRPASSGFLQATGTRLVRGRWFDARDRHGSLPVAVVNEAAVRMHYADRDPIGLLIKPDVTWGFATSPEYTIVGVVEDVVKYGPRDEPAPALYVPNNQFGANTGYVSIRLAPGAATAIPDARRIVASLDPSLALWNVVTMEEVVADANASTVFFTTLLAIFAAVALVLAAVGLYGVVAYAVTQRTREIGIRIALGAASAEVTGMVLREGFRPAVMGIVLGLLISSFAARLLSSLLFGVGWNDPIVLVSVSLLLLTVTVVAAAIPARRASRVPPASALQAD